MKVEFESMELKKDNAVNILGKIVSSTSYNEKVKIKMSILQLAKVWSSDKNVGEELESMGFGSQELEEQCKETRKMIRNFPHIKFWNKEVECYQGVKVIRKPKIVRIYE